MPLAQNFYAQDTLIVARSLLGTKLVCQTKSTLASGVIVETEAYLGRLDSASHAYRGKTQRNTVMFGPAGFAYVYLIYGLHSMFNVVTEAEGSACAVLCRAIEPLDGTTEMAARRNSSGYSLTNGPGKLCQALGIDQSFNQWDLTQGKSLWIEPYQTVSDADIATGPRIRIQYASPKDQQAPWRFWLETNRYVSK